MSTVQGRCSHCLGNTAHILKKENTKKRSIYECGTCHKRTLPCKKCGSAFTKGGVWDDNKCAVCDGKVSGWPSTEEERRNQRAMLAEAAENRAKATNSRGGGKGNARMGAAEIDVGNNFDANKWN